MSFERIPLTDFNEKFSALPELSSVALDGRIVAVSDELFAKAFHLLLVEPAPSMKGQFGPNGALYSGWESRRHNPLPYDWCIIQLGTTGTISGFDIDTTNFNGNEAPEASVYALYDAELKDPQNGDPRWSEILPRVNLGPSSRHLFKIPATPAFNYVKIHMYPDGGIARFRTYGQVIPVHPSDNSVFDLASVSAGGRVLCVSDQHFGVGSNLILPGRGKNMGDGWETKRSRTKGHNDWVVIQFCTPGLLEQVEIDTNHFLGNFPESCAIDALYTDQDIAWETAVQEAQRWTSILPRTKLGPDRQHYFELENVKGKTYTHVKVTIYPDGGIKRLRFRGRKVEKLSGNGSIKGLSDSQQTMSAPSVERAPADSLKTVVIPVVPLEAEAFSPFGQIIQAYKNLPNGIKVTPANGGTANKYHKLSLLKAFYPSDAGATAGISVYRCQPLGDVVDGTIVLKTLERHPHTNQAFIPMGSGDGEGLNDPGCGYLVVVARNGSNDQPDTQTLKAFLASSAQGIAYNPGVWHQPMTVLEKPLDLACVETQIGDGSPMDCEIVELACTIHLKAQ